MKTKSIIFTMTIILMAMFMTPVQAQSARKLEAQAKIEQAKADKATADAVKAKAQADLEKAKADAIKAEADLEKTKLTAQQQNWNSDPDPTTESTPAQVKIQTPVKVVSSPVGVSNTETDPVKQAELALKQAKADAQLKKDIEAAQKKHAAAVDTTKKAKPVVHIYLKGNPYLSISNKKLVVSQSEYDADNDAYDSLLPDEYEIQTGKDTDVVPRITGNPRLNVKGKKLLIAKSNIDSKDDLLPDGFDPEEKPR